MIEFKLFGPLAVTDETGRDLRPKLLKSRAILAVLAATSGHRHTRSWLQSLFWQDRQPEQAMSSLRSALADIRRHLGDQADALLADHNDVALNPALIRVHDRVPGSSEEFLEGFDLRNAERFEDWIRTKRNSLDLPSAKPGSYPGSKHQHCSRLFLASSGRNTSPVTQMQCDALVDCIAKSTEDMDLASVVDGRGQGVSIDEFCERAANAGCEILLVSETAQNASHSYTRLKLLECDTAKLLWSRSLIGEATLDLESPANVSVVADFIEVLTERLVRPFDWQTDQLSAQVMAITGVSHIFKLGHNNYKTADLLLKRAYFQDPKAATLAWRAFLRTFLIGERAYLSREEVVEEGTEMARRALEAEPRNSIVLSLCAHVENMLHDNYESAFDLSARALSLNRCNPIAWACLGRAASSLGETEKGKLLSQYGAKLSNGTKYSFLVDSWASSSGLIAQDLVAARQYCEKSLLQKPSFSPPLRFLSALYCADGQFDRARAAVEKLKQQEPDFSVQRLRDQDYPSDTLKQAGILEHIPAFEF